MDHNKRFHKENTRFLDLEGWGQGKKSQIVSFYKINAFIVFLNVFFRKYSELLLTLDIKNVRGIRKWIFEWKRVTELMQKCVFQSVRGKKIAEHLQTGQKHQIQHEGIMDHNKKFYRREPSIPWPNEHYEH